MNVAIFGLGYVGSVTAACLAKDGHNVIGVDTNSGKVDMINSGRSPVLEPGLNDIIAEEVAGGRLTATTDAYEAVTRSEVSLVCVGTPSRANGSLELSYVDNVVRQIGNALTQRADYHTVVVRSTVLPGTVLDRVVPIIEHAANKQAGKEFGVAMNPEFLREGSALKDYNQPSMIVIGQLNSRSGDAVAKLYENIDGPTIRTDLATAEMVKYASNAFHGMKVAFANEIGRISKAHGVDGQVLMEIFREDKRLNVSGAYLTPGNAFGGSCLPKDTRALVYRARERDVTVPLLESLMPSNTVHLDTTIRLVESSGSKRIGVLGLSFKPGTDDVRESPAVVLVETLLGRGYSVQIFDEQLELHRLIGANKSYLESELPHIAQLLRSDLDGIIKESEVLVVTQASPTFRDLAGSLVPEKLLIDLVGVAKPGEQQRGRYEGICW